jgi:hypothetical protein
MVLLCCILRVCYAYCCIFVMQIKNFEALQYHSFDGNVISISFKHIIHKVTTTHEQHMTLERKKQYVQQYI